MADIEHVGMLVVHGIGEQKRFETAGDLARAVGGTLAADKSHPEFSLIDRVGSDETRPTDLPSMHKDETPFEIRVKRKGKCPVHIHIHEVWWADLGAPATLLEQIRFWFWGLGQWAALERKSTHFNDKVSNTDLLMDMPNFDRPFWSSICSRIALFIAAYFAFLTLFSWNALKRAVTWVAPMIGSSSILTQYIGDVRIYSQEPALGGGNLIDVGQPWRTTIRRRMIAEMVAMAERRYDRWYLLGHSLGSVIAYNGIQETEWTLPNYLSKAHFSRLWLNGLRTNAPFTPKDKPNPDLARMMPRRPVWLGETDGISRAGLFANFRGMLTYGSPLDKFAAIWPRIVCLNKQTGIFREVAPWVNLSDATDPIGAELNAFKKTDGMEPINLRSNASPFFLLAHISYFGARKPGKKADTVALLSVLVEASGLKEAFETVGQGLGWRMFRMMLAVVQFAILSIMLVAASAWLSLLVKALITIAVSKSPHWLLCLWATLLGWLHCLFGEGYFAAIRFTLAMAFTIVFLSGLRRFGKDAYARINAPSQPTPPPVDPAQIEPE